MQEPVIFTCDTRLSREGPVGDRIWTTQPYFRIIDRSRARFIAARTVLLVILNKVTSEWYPVTHFETRKLLKPIKTRYVVVRVSQVVHEMICVTHKRLCHTSCVLDRRLLTIAWHTMSSSGPSRNESLSGMGTKCRATYRVRIRKALVVCFDSVRYY